MELITPISCNLDLHNTGKYEDFIVVTKSIVSYRFYLMFPLMSPLTSHYIQLLTAY